MSLASGLSRTHQPLSRATPEIRTFEIKTYDSLDATAVYEALAHRRAAHYAYVFVHIPDRERAVLEPVLDRLVGDAREHGIGFVIIRDIASYDTWEIEVDARRGNPNPADLDAFIRTQTSDDFKQKILGWCRTV